MQELPFQTNMRWYKNTVSAFWSYLYRDSNPISFSLAPFMCTYHWSKNIYLFIPPGISAMTVKIQKPPITVAVTHMQLVERAWLTEWRL